MRRLLGPVVAGCLLVPVPGAGAIVGGGDAPAGKFPYVANVAIADAAGCSGSLIAPNWVMTAGHCVSATGAGGVPLPATLPASSFRVTVGTVEADGTGGETRTVKSVHVDPNYAATNGTGSDVGLLELSTAATVEPVRIAAESERSIWEPGDQLAIVGFGVTEEDGDAPPRLQEAQVPRVSDPDCAKAYDDPTPVLGNAFDPKTALCAGNPQGGTDTCQGDSGGPILAPLGSGFRLVGATSYGEGCAREGKPGVYARVAEGSVKTFVSGLVPEAYATSDSPAPTTPAPAAGATCAGKPGLTIRVARFKGAKLRRARVTVAGATVVKRHAKALKAFKVRLAKRLPQARRTTVKVVAVSSKGTRRITTRTYENCARTSRRTTFKPSA